MIGNDDRSRPKPWFRAKRYGYGAGLPIAWQGWAVLLGFVAALLALMPLFIGLMQRGSLLAILPAAGMLGAVILLFRICERRSDRKWAWRWGDDD